MIKVSSLVGVAVFILITAGCSSTPKIDTVTSESTAVVSDNSADKAGEAQNKTVPVTPPPSKSETQPEKKFEDPYELSRFMGDFKQYHKGDPVPDLYRSQEYTISQWQLRNLPAPSEDSHWTYFGGTYVLITDDQGKILRMFDGDIIYKQP